MRMLENTQNFPCFCFLLDVYKHKSCREIKVTSINDSDPLVSFLSSTDIRTFLNKKKNSTALSNLYKHQLKQ